MRTVSVRIPATTTERLIGSGTGADTSSGNPIPPFKTCVPVAEDSQVGASMSRMTRIWHDDTDTEFLREDVNATIEAQTAGWTTGPGSPGDETLEYRSVISFTRDEGIPVPLSWRLTIDRIQYANPYVPSTYEIRQLDLPVAPLDPLTDPWNLGDMLVQGSINPPDHAVVTVDMPVIDPDIVWIMIIDRSTMGDDTSGGAAAPRGSAGTGPNFSINSETAINHAGGGGIPAAMTMEAIHVQAVTCPDAPPPVFGQLVLNEVDPLGGDGVTTTGTTALPYIPGSLVVSVNGVPWPVTEVNPSSGAYSFALAPPNGADILRTYQAGTGLPDVLPPGPGPDIVPTLPAVSSGPTQPAGALQARINAATAGSVLSIPFGTYHEEFTVNKTLDIRMNGSTITGDGTRSTWCTIAADNVSISDCWMINALPDPSSGQKTPQTGSIHAVGHSGLTLSNVHARQGRDCNLRLQDALNAVLTGCSFNQAPRAGMTCGPAPNLTIRDCQFNDNLTDSGYDPQWEGGGYKIGGSGSTNVLIERTEASNNGGPGHWIDEHPSNVTVRDCWGHHNEYSTFMFEISHGATYVRCRSWESGWGDPRGASPGSGDWGWGAGFLVSSAGVVNIQDCISAWDSAGITRINQGDRSNRESTVQLIGSGNFIAGDTNRRISSWHEDGSGNQVLFTNTSNTETGLQWYSVGGEYFAWSGELTAAQFAATRGGIGLTNASSGTKNTLLSGASIGGVANVGIPTTPEAH